MAVPTPPQPLQIDPQAILFESRRIVDAHYCHFLALSFLFLLPFSFSFFAYPCICQLFSQSSGCPTGDTHLMSCLLNPFQRQHPTFFPTKTIIFFLLYTLFVLTFSLLATGSVTYSVFNGFYGRPVKLISALKSAFTSFPRLLSTCLVSQLIVYGFFSLLALIIFSTLKATQLLGFQVNYSSPDFLSLRLAFFVIIFICINLIYIQVNWTFTNVVVVVESSWGLEPLKRSKYLVRGMRWVAFSMLSYFWFSDVFLWWATATMWDATATIKGEINWLFVVIIVFNSIYFTMVLLSNLAATTVFYIYSKAKRGELEGEIAEEIATDHEYVKVPIDDGKVPHVV